jgi:hypothetical protein
VVGSDTYFNFRGYVYEQLLVVKYDSNGNQLWTAANNQGNAPSTSVQIGGAALDGANNLYLVADFDPVVTYVTFMYNADGSVLWTAYPNNNGYSLAHALALDQIHSILMTGQIPSNFLPNYNPLFSYGTIKLATNGSTLWTSLYPASATSTNVGNSLVLDQNGNSYVTGCSMGTNSGNDIVTIKYGPNGNQVWLQRYHGLGNGNNAGNAIAVDNNGNVYVTGYDTTAAGGTEMVTIKYSPVTLQRRSDGTVLLQAQGLAGESFDFQGSTDLMNWLDLGSVLADSNGVAQFQDTNASNYNWRFYITSPQ